MAVETIPPPERIRELSVIDNDAAQLLNFAGQAINTLTNRPLSTTGEDAEMTDDSTNTVEARKQAFADNATTFLEGIQGVMARLRRQAIALEEAGIITSESTSLGASIPRALPRPVGAQQGSASSSAPRNEPDRIVNGGLGKFDVGWLNSRGNKVNEEKEAELMQEAKELLEEALAQQKEG